METQYRGFFIFLLVLTIIAVVYLIGTGFSSTKTVQGCPVLKTCGPDDKIYLYQIVEDTCPLRTNDPVCQPSGLVDNSLPYTDLLDLTSSFPVISSEPLPDWSTTTVTNIEVYSHFPTLSGPESFPTCDLSTKDSIPYGTQLPSPLLVANFDICDTPVESPEGTFTWQGCSGITPNGEEYVAVWTNNGNGTLTFDLTGTETFMPAFLYWRISYEVTDAEGCTRSGLAYYDFRFGL